MKNLFVPYEFALLAKEKGFDEICFGYYVLKTEEFKLIDDILFNNTGYTGTKCFLATAPLYQQLTDYFRENHKILVYAKECSEGSWLTDFAPTVETVDHHETYSFYYNYYEALNQAIIKAFKLI